MYATNLRHMQSPEHHQERCLGTEARLNPAHGWVWPQTQSKQKTTSIE